ncbi:MAG: hypothetical protein JSU81_09905 [Candidatus Coatesbacteria bacterium]|nr:MAG: hypothetical protein JSU81_09905 [Candidatus Coatesbacteria bacterium]
MTGKRVIACTLFGLIAGIICWLVSQYGGAAGVAFTTPIILGIVLNRGFIGFAIGLSGWRTHWAFHGVVIGLLGSLPLAVYALGSPGGLKGFLMMELAGGVWGLLIELGALAVGARKR